MPQHLDTSPCHPSISRDPGVSQLGTFFMEYLLERVKDRQTLVIQWPCLADAFLRMNKVSL